MRPNSRQDKGIKEAKAHLDQNLLDQLRRGSPDLDCGPLGWPLFHCRTAPCQRPAPPFGANVALENRD